MCVPQHETTGKVGYQRVSDQPVTILMACGSATHESPVAGESVCLDGN